MRGTRRTPETRLLDERGAALPLLVLFLPLSFLLLALAADAGALLAARGLVHAAADLAALGGVQEIDLERLAAAGERVLRPEAAERAREVAAAILAGNRLGGPGSRVTAAVLDASPSHPRRHPWSGRLLRDPTLAVRVGAPVPLAFSGPAHRSAWVEALADASVLPRRRGRRDLDGAGGGEDGGAGPDAGRGGAGP